MVKWGLTAVFGIGDRAGGNEGVGADGRVYLLHDEGRFCFLHTDDFQYA